MSDDKKKTKKSKEHDSSKYIDLNPTTEEADSDIDEARQPLTVQQRRERGRTMRRFKSKIAAARKRASRRKASPEKLKQRARKKAIGIIRNRLMKNKSYGEMSPAEKIALDKRVQKVPQATLARIARKELPNVRKAEILKKQNAGKTKTEEVDHTTHDSDAPVRKKRFHQLFKKEGDVNIDKRFKMFKKKELDEDFDMDNFIDLVEEVGIEEDVSKEIKSKLQNKEVDSKVKMALTALRKVVMSKGDKQSVGGYAFDIARSYNVGLNGKQLEKMYMQVFESVDPNDREEGTDSLVKILKKDTPNQKDVNEKFSKLFKGE